MACYEDDDYYDEAAFDEEQTRSYVRAAMRFMDHIWPMRRLILDVSRKCPGGPTSIVGLQKRMAVLEHFGLEKVMMDLPDRPASVFEPGEKIPVNGKRENAVHGLEIFQMALQLGWGAFPEYSTGLHMMTEYFAEKMATEDLLRLTADTVETFRAIAKAKTTHPLWNSDGPGAAATAVLARIERKASFADVATGMRGRMLRFQEAFSKVGSIPSFIEANPEATDAEFKAERERIDREQAELMAKFTMGTIADRIAQGDSRLTSAAATAIAAAADAGDVSFNVLASDCTAKSSKGAAQKHKKKTKGSKHKSKGAAKSNRGGTTGRGNPLEEDDEELFGSAPSFDALKATKEAGSGKSDEDNDDHLFVDGPDFDALKKAMEEDALKGKK